MAVYFDRGWEMAQSILDFQTLEKIDMKMLIQLLRFFVDTGTEVVSCIGIYIS